PLYAQYLLSFLSSSAPRRSLPSFPTRRSSDLARGLLGDDALVAAQRLVGGETGQLAAVGLDLAAGEGVRQDREPALLVGAQLLGVEGAVGLRAPHGGVLAGDGVGRLGEAGAVEIIGHGRRGHGVLSRSVSVR